MSVLILCAIAFVLAYVSAMPILGPISVMAITRGIEGRFDEARKLGIGAAVAEGTYASVAFAFATLFTRYPAALPISRVLTSVVLVVVGISCIRYTPKPIEAVHERKAQSARSSERVVGSAFALGFLTSGLNPTIIVMWTAATAGIHSRQIVHMESWMAVPFGISACLGISAWYVTLVALMTRYHSRLPARGMRLFIQIMGGVLLGIAGWTVFSIIR